MAKNEKTKKRKTKERFGKNQGVLFFARRLSRAREEIPKKTGAMRENIKDAQFMNDFFDSSQKI